MASKHRQSFTSSRNSFNTNDDPSNAPVAQGPPTANGDQPTPHTPMLSSKTLDVSRLKNRKNTTVLTSSGNTFNSNPRDRAMNDHAMSPPRAFAPRTPSLLAPRAIPPNSPFKAPALPAGLISASNNSHEVSHGGPISHIDDSRYSPDVSDPATFSAMTHQSYMRAPASEEQESLGKRFSPPGEGEQDFPYGVPDMSKRFRPGHGGQDPGSINNAAAFGMNGNETYIQSRPNPGGAGGMAMSQLAVPPTLDVNVMEEWKRTHPEVVQRAQEKWTSCTLEEWYKGADEIQAQFGRILKRMTDNMVKRQTQRQAFFDSIRAHGKTLANQAANLQEMRDRFMHNGTALVEPVIVVEDEQPAGTKETQS